MKPALIVQARFGATRLPGKTLLPVRGRSILSIVLERCQAVRGIGTVVCCVPSGERDEAVAAEASRCGVVVTRGPEQDVLARYLLAAREVAADPIMRVTSDCPLLDPFLATAVLDTYHLTKVDIACNDLLPLYPHGLGCEVFSRDWLERAAREADESQDREHVSPYIYRHPEARLMNLLGPGADAAQHRWTLDTPEDFALIRAIIERLPPGPDGWRWTMTRAIVESDPTLLAASRGRDLRQNLP